MPSNARCEVRTEDEPDGTGTVVVVEGDVDIDAVGMLLDAIGTAGTAGAAGPADDGAAEVADDGGRRRVVVDMSGTTFIDSTGVFALVRSHEACQDAGTTMVVRSPSASVRRVFELTRLNQMLTIEPAP